MTILINLLIVGGKIGAKSTCVGCNGRGIRITMRQMGPMIQQMQQTCPDCNGEGEIIKEKDKCQVCRGKKISSERKVWRNLMKYL